jgi:uncharacterized protein
LHSLLSKATKMNFLIAGEPVTLLPEKVLYLPKHKTVLVADLHFGKVNHFRKSGIAVPSKANDKNADTLINVINATKPARVIFLGDLFHSHYNEEWETVGQILKHFSACSFELVLGNHDILSLQQYQRHSIKVFGNQLVIGQWLLTHEPLTSTPENFYNLAGHIHPGARLTGSGRQSMMLPCFYFGKQQGILPAFGSFTGLAAIHPKKDENVFVIAEGRILKIQN